MAVTMLDIALKYAEYGFKPFPMVANTKRMYKGSEGYLDGTSDKKQLIKLFNERGIDSNIGLNMVGTHYIVIHRPA